jgi:DNA-binding transcriptional regulator YhcF (GntR family)
MRNFLKIVKVDRESIMPMYLQVFESIKVGVEGGQITNGDVLPSIHDMCYALDMSKNTVEKAYNQLKKVGLLDSVRGKGYYISAPQTKKKKILLLFNKLSTHKKIIYDSFMNMISHYATVDLCVYNNSVSELSNLINEKSGNYQLFIVIPPFINNDLPICDIIKKIAPEKLYILDRTLRYKELYRGAVYQDFERDIYGALESMIERLRKYDVIKIVFPDNTPHATEIVSGFELFCRKNKFQFKIITDVEKEKIAKGTVYISLMEDDLVILIEKILYSNLVPGRDIGVISYNETPLKKMLLNGLTTISTDFKMMGEKMAELILEDSNQHIAVPFHTICRNSV